MKAKKLVALLAAAALSVSALAGCGSEKKESSESQKESSVASSSAESSSAQSTSTAGAASGSETTPSTEEKKEPVKLKVRVPENLKISDWETNAMTLWLEEQGNLDLEFEVLAASDYATKNRMDLTVGDIEALPDVIMGSWNLATIQEFADAETILPLTEYYDNPETAVNINEAIERTGVDYPINVTCPDGEIYGIATFNQSYSNEYPARIFIYKPWLDALNEDIPTTTEEFYELLQKVCATDLNGNGKKDEIGILGSNSTGGFSRYYHALMGGFCYPGDDDFKVVEDGKVSLYINSDEYKEGLKFIRKFYAENLIIPETLTMDDTQAKALLNAEEQVVFSYATTGLNSITNVDRRNGYVGIDSLTGPDGVNFTMFRATTPTISMIVTANCENPEAAFRLGDLMSSEYIGISQRWGEEGVNWDYAKNVKDSANYVATVEGFDLSIVAYDDATFWGGAEAQNHSWKQCGPYVRHYGIANGVAVDPAKVAAATKEANASAVLYQTQSRHPENVFNAPIFTAEENEIYAELDTNITSYVNEMKAAFLSGNLDIDANWDSYLKELENIGLSELIELYQTVYDRMYK